MAVFDKPMAGRITSKYGYRTHPVTKERGVFHNGIDISAPTGTPIYAPEYGVVIDVLNTERGGLTLYIKHGDFETRYCHMSKINVVKGEVVMKGSKIAECGNTGVSSGPHLHFGVKLKGNYVDPEDYI